MKSNYMSGDKRKFDQIKFNRRSGPSATNSYFGMREFLGTSVKKIATYETGSSTMQ